MKFLTSLAITIVLTASSFAQTLTPNGPTAQATQELNAAAKAYREGYFADAQAHAERALQLDPQNKAALMYIARTIHAQYRPGHFTPENVAKAREAITAYKRILERLPGDDESYKAVAHLYGAIKEDGLMREWIVQRANDSSLSNNKRAEAFVVLASKDWDCSFKITEQPETKETLVDENKLSIRYRMPKERAEFDKAQQCSNHGLEMTNIAIMLAPENESAWSYHTNILLELAKLAEMSGDAQQKAEFRRQYENALEQTTALAKRSESKP